MGWKAIALTMGVGAAIGAIAITMMPRDNTTRKLASKAANKVEDIANRVSVKISEEFSE